MSKDAKQAPVAPVNEICKFEECKKKQNKFGFCAEHYELYMDGVIRGDGHKPSDYQEKLALWHSKRAKKVA